MRSRIIFAALAAAVALPLGSEAIACIYLPVTEVGPPPSDRERAERQRRAASEGRRLGLLAARGDLARGGDPARFLAEILIPNIRPVRIRRSDCGAENEIDIAYDEETPEDWLAGTRFAGRSDEFPRLVRDYERQTIGPTCNAEFRGRFALYLRRRLSPEQLRDSYLFLGTYWAPPERVRMRWRLVAFDAGARRPPFLWIGVDAGEEREIRRWLRLVPTGRALKAAIDGFWSESAPLLGDIALACPAAAAAWPAEQARIVAELDEQVARWEAARSRARQR